MSHVFTARPVAHRSRRRWPLLLVAFVLTLGLGATSTGSVTPGPSHASETSEFCDLGTMDIRTLTDVDPESTHANAIACMVAYEIIHGRVDGTFGPHQALTRGQMASLLTRLLSGAGLDPDLAASPEPPFEDIGGSVHAGNISLLHELGIAHGVSDTNFDPTGPLSREQMASFLRRAFDVLDIELSGTHASSFEDVLPESVHGEAIASLAGVGIIHGGSPTSFFPREVLSRQQAASLLHRSAEALFERGRWTAEIVDRGDADADVVITGDQRAGFTVPAGQTWQVEGDVTTTANVVVYGILKMRAGSSLTFLEVDEEAFVGPGDVNEPVDEDVGLWVFGQGQLDIQGTPKQSWNRTGFHETWEADDEYVAAPQGRDGAAATPWALGEPVPCVEFAGESYCTEIVNLTRDVTIQGTQDGRAHVFVRSHKPQTVRYATFRHMGPNGDGPVDGRYPLHFHMMHEGSRGSLIEGVLVRDAGDHAFVPHHSNGMTFRDTVAYNVQNTAYWWDPDHRTDDTLYERALALEVSSGRDTGAHLNGFRMAKGVGNACIECVAVQVSGGRPSAGFGWTEDHPNKWEFRDSIAHNNNNGVYHWRNEPHVPEGSVHEHIGFVAYHNSRHGIEQGAYVIQAHWHDTVLFGNGHDGLINRGSPRRDVVPGVAYRGGTFGSDGDSPAIAIRKMGSCPSDDNHILFEDLHLLESATAAVHVDKDSCGLHGGQLDVRFRDVVVGLEERDLEPGDFQIDALPPDGVITVYRTDGTRFKIEG